MFVSAQVLVLHGLHFAPYTDGCFFFCVIPRYGAVGAAWVTSAANMIRAMVCTMDGLAVGARDRYLLSAKRLPLEVMD